MRTVLAAWPLASPPRYSLTSKSGANRRLVEVGGPAGLSHRIGQAILCQGFFPQGPPILASSTGLVDAALAGSSFMTAGELNFLVCNVELRLRSLTEPFSCSPGDLKTKLVPVLEPLRWNATRSMTRCLDEVARPMIAHWDRYEHRC